MASLSRPEADLRASSEAFRAKALRVLGSLPPFSPILNRLLASLAEEDVSFAKLADLIEKDTVIAGNILQLVNSALYGRRGTINSVRHAISLLGMNKLRNAVLGMSITRMWNHAHAPTSWSMARFNLHSAATAILSDLLSQRLPVNYPEGAFAAGLLHDLGRLLLALGVPEECNEVIALHQQNGMPIHECEREVFGFTHADLSAEALALWNLPEPIQTAVREHHSSVPDSDKLLPLASIVGISDQYVDSQEIAILPSDATAAGQSVALEGLRLTPEQVGAVTKEFETEFRAMTPFFR